MTRFFFALCSVALLGCDALLGIEVLPRGVVDDASVTPDTADAPAPINEACAQCSKSECVAERADCEANTACARLLDRLDRCQVDDVACRARAETDTGATAESEPFIKLDRCRRDKCVDTCYGLRGLLAGIDARCGCAEIACQAEIRNCIQSEIATALRPGMCERRIACLAARPDPDGFVSCVGETPAGGNSYPLLDCAHRTVCDECPLAPGKLECVGNFSYGRSRGDFLSYTLRVQDPVESKPVVGARVVACAEPFCEPCTELGEAALTGSNGKANIAMLPNPPGGFKGCFRVQPPTDPPNLMPMLIYSGRNVYQTEDVMGTLMLGRVALQLFANSVGKTANPARGHIIGTVHDCIWGHMPGAKLKTIGDSETVLGYIDGLSPDLKRTSTTSDGSFAYLNVPPGFYTLEAEKDGKLVGTIRVQVVADHFTDANIYPLERP